MTNRYLEDVPVLHLYSDWQGNIGFFFPANAARTSFHFMRYAPDLVPIRLNVTAATILSEERYTKLRREPLTDDD